MDPLDYLRILRRRWWVWASVLVLALVAGALSIPRGDEVSRGPLATSFTATHTLLQSPGVQEPVSLELTRLFTTTGEIPRIAAQALGRPADDGPAIAAGISVTVDPDVAAMRISAVGTDGEQAARTANAFGEAVKEFLRTQADGDRAAEVTTLLSRTASLEQRILDLQRRLAAEPLETPLLEAQQSAFTNQYQGAFERLQSLQSQPPASSPLETLEEAVPIVATATGSPVPTSPRGRLALALVVGLVLGLGLALAVDRLDTRMRTRHEIEDATGLPVVAEIPRLPKRVRTGFDVVTVTSPGSGPAEAYRGLRAAVLLVPSRPVAHAGAEPPPLDLSTWRPPQVLLVTSPAPAEGKTSTVVNLAAAMAESGRSVIVLDADFRNPNANRYLGVARSPGLSDVLAGSLAGGLTRVLRPTSVEGVRLVTSGTSSRTPGAMLSHLGEVVTEARTLADVVIIDVAPMLAANDATDILPHVDSVLLVTHAGRTSAQQAERAVDLLARLGPPVLGVVVQAAAEADGLGSYDGYGPSSEDSPETTGALAPDADPDDRTTTRKTFHAKRS